MNTLQINVGCACKKLKFLLAHALQKESEFFINYENHYMLFILQGLKCCYDILIVSVLIVSQFFYYI